MRSSREAMRSLTPSLPVRSAEACSSACTATRKSRAGPGTAEANAAESVCAEPSAARAARAFRLARNSSTVLASQTVQVTTEANARPAMTAFTITSADRNMPHGDRSRGSAEDRPAGGLGLLRPGRTCQREEQRRAQRHDGGTRAPALAPASAVMGEGLSGPHLRPLWLELDVGEQANARARQQHLVLGVGDAVADVGVEQVGPDQANGELLDLAGPHHGGHPAAADLDAQVVVAGGRRLAGDGDVVLRESVQQVHAREPGIVAIKKAAADPHRRDARHVGAVREGRTHDVELVLDSPPAVPDPLHVELALELGTAERRIPLRIDRLPEVADAGTADSGVAVAGVAGQVAEDEALELGVVGGGLEAERPHGAAQAGLDRGGGLDAEVGIALVEGRGRVVAAARKQLGRLGGALGVLRRDAADQIPRQALDQADAR